MSDFDEFFETLKTELKDLVKQNWKDIINTAETAGNEFLNETKDDLQRWTKLLANRDLTKDEFEFLVASKADLFKLEALKQLGLTKVRIQKFQNAVIGLVIDTAFEVFL